MSDTQFDVIIIGGGPGGYVAAIRAAQLGLKTAVVEEKHLGGICLNWGCIPTKALLRSAEVLDLMRRASEFGLNAQEPGFDLKAVVERSRGVSKRLSSGVQHLLKKNKVTVYDGRGTITGKGSVEVKLVEGKSQALKAKHIIVATGARPRELPGLEADGKNVWSYFEALVPTDVPKKLLVIGSGAIGIEFASFYNALGAEVTVVEVMDRIMPVEDEEISTFAAKLMKKHGLEIITKATVEKLERGAKSVKAHVKNADGETAVTEFDKVISAVGVVGNIENLGLEALGVKTDRGCVVIDDYGRTNVESIYAIGDVAGPPMLAHKAEHEGVICVEKIAGLAAHAMDKNQIPGCTYCHPQVASVGMTERAAKEAGHEVRVGRFPFLANGKAIALGEDQGLIKTVFDKKTGQLLGAHMVGAEVTELIQGFVIAMKLETTEEELMETVFPHPTLSEMMHESTLDAFGRVIHM